MPFDERAEFLEERGDTYTGALNALARLEGELDRLKNIDEAPGLRKRTADIATISSFCSNRRTPTPSSGSSAAPPAESARLRKRGRAEPAI